jgi:hypothetical protein
MPHDGEAASYRLRAQRLRLIAAEDRSRQNRQLLERVAQDYEQMARDVEARDAGGESGQ